MAYGQDERTNIDLRLVGKMNSTISSVDFFKHGSPSLLLPYFASRYARHCPCPCPAAAAAPAAPNEPGACMTLCIINHSLGVTRQFSSRLTLKTRS